VTKKVKDIIEVKAALDQHRKSHVEAVLDFASGMRVIESDLVEPDGMTLLVGRDVYAELRRQEKARFPLTAINRG
jgi:hypothetical protein